MTDFLERYSLFILTAAIAVVSLFWRRNRVRVILEAWANANQVEIVSRKIGFFRPGPFFFTLGHQAVYFLTVRDHNGVERRCWVRIGGFFAGLLSDDVETRWE